VDTELGQASVPQAERERVLSGERPVRIAAVGDLHARLDRPGRLRRALREVNDEADLLLLAGDLTDQGLLEEAEMLMDELSVVRVPKVAVLGNHDHEQGKAAELAHLLARGGVRVLDGDVYVFDNRVGIAGVKGFGGGFDGATLEPWGEQIVKQFVLEAVNESLKLETALARVRQFDKRIALMHYAPIHQTIVGEEPEIVPFLGCSRLSEPVDKFAATLAIHGHAHRGQLTGQTPRGRPVYNAAMELLVERTGRRFLVLEV
jgi:Icc-related predicted phosphoesterase